MFPFATRMPHYHIPIYRSLTRLTCSDFGHTQFQVSNLKSQIQSGCTHTHTHTHTPTQRVTRRLTFAKVNFKNTAWRGLISDANCCSAGVIPFVVQTGWQNRRYLRNHFRQQGCNAGRWCGKYGPGLSSIIDYKPNALFQKPQCPSQLIPIKLFLPVALMLLMEHVHEFWKLD